jgi:molecular chaperone HscC
MAIIGIDLGTTNSLCCVWKDGRCVLIPNSLGEYLTPSVVSADENDVVLTGKIAKERMITHPVNTASSFKLFMGTKKNYVLRGKAYQPEELSAIILRRLKEDAEVFLGEQVDEAVISVPAYFNNNQRSQTKLAGELAGMKVERIINEPSAAAIAYRHQIGRDGTYLVTDFGGGTLDISVVEIFENIVDIIAVAGDNHLGGNDIDKIIADAFYARYPELQPRLSMTERASVNKMAEQCKINLTRSEQALMVFVHNEKTYDMYMTNQLLADLCAPILAKLKAVLRHALKDSRKTMPMIDEIVLVGGSGKMPVVKSFLTHITGKEPRCDIDPDKAIAIGAGIVTGIKTRQEDIRDMIMTDICPFTLGTSVQSRLTNNPYEFSPIIERNAPLPVSNQRSYFNVRDNQLYMVIDAYQGESASVLNNVLLGNLTIPIPPAPAGKAEVQLRFTYDINGILEVDATCRQTGQTWQKLILTNSDIPENELEERRRELQILKISPRDKDENRYLLERGARLYEEHTGLMREIIKEETDRFVLALEHHFHPSEFEKVRQRFIEFLDAHEEDDDVIFGGNGE